VVELEDLARERWNGQSNQKDCSPILFPLKLDVSQYPRDKRSAQPYQFVGVIAHIGGLQDNRGYYLTFLSLYWQWKRYNGTDVSRVNQCQAVEETASILLYQADT
jgi:hypothetical protein